jgi:pimeloyl-ACP methyl ester carboxylesterase
MVIISPQFVGPSVYVNPPTAGQIDGIIDYACNNYRVDRSHIYLAGVSMGGGRVLEYAAAFPYRVAAIIPFAGAAGAYQPWADAMSASNLPVWLINNTGDPVVGPWVSQGWVNVLNNPSWPIPAPTPLAYGTFPNINGHVYDDQYRGVDTASNGMNENVYKWMLQFSRADYFVGGSGTAWENPDNWSYKQVPGDTTEVVINTGPIVINSNASCKKLTLKPGVSFTINPGYNLSVKK